MDRCQPRRVVEQSPPAVDTSAVETYKRVLLTAAILAAVVFVALTVSFLVESHPCPYSTETVDIDCGGVGPT